MASVNAAWTLQSSRKGDANGCADFLYEPGRSCYA
jgi:hypothetical protein